MNAAAGTPQASQADLAPLPTDTVIEADHVEAEPSIADHAKQFGPQATKAPAQAQAATPEELKPIRPVDRQNRDQGKFAEGTRRIKAKDAVERINQLTGRAKTAEEENTRLKGELDTAKRELATARQIGTQAQVTRAEAKVERAEARVEKQATGFAEPEPQEDDPKFGGDYGKYLRAAAGWEGRKAYWEAQQAERSAADERRVQESHQQTLKSWSGRVSAAKEKHPDFERVAFGPTRIPAGSAVDAFIMEDDSGAEVLYHLQTHPEELDSLLGMPVLGQLKTLALLSQRLLSPQDAQAGSTGSVVAPTPTVVLPPKPPNPVRTEAQRASDSPPPTDGSLSIAEHAKQFGPAARR